jgi:hypothetical protein
VDGCTGTNTARGWCNVHYRRWQRTGDPLKAAWERGDPVANFWAKVRRGRPGQCWPWTGAISPDGYGLFVSEVGNRAHRFSYRLAHGSITDGQLDHLCHTASADCGGGSACMHRRCVNPGHLEPVTHAENMGRMPELVRRTRGTVTGARQRAKTHCPKGHEYDEANTYVDKRGCRNCRTCAREKHRMADRSTYQREYYERTKTKT